MGTTEITTKHFEALRLRFGNHSKAAKALGITPNHYTFVRSTGNMSGPLRALISSLCGDVEEPTPTPPPYITHDPRVGITCHACDTVAEGVTLDSPEGRQFVADHSGHEYPYVGMRRADAARSSR